MAGVSSEEENYLRLFMLILEPGTTAIRVVFDRYFPPLQLESQLRGSLNISLKKLKKSKIINSAQWDILFPSSGHVSSREFDITLMICLLRNLSNLPRPINGFDALPPRNCYNPEDDVARIKYCRNFQAHSHTGRLDNNTFAALWSDARSAIERLDQSIAAECDKIEAMTFTSIHRTLLSQLLASNDELRKNVEVIEEQGKRIGELETKCLQICRNMEDSDKLPKLLQGIQRREIWKWKVDDEAFIDTTLSKEFLKQVQNVSIMTVTGHSGVGKTSLLRHTALKLQEKGYSVIPLPAIKDLKLNYCRDVKQVFVIDDPLGTIELSREKLQSWHDNEIHIVRVLNDTKSKLLISVGISIACTNEFKIFNSLNNHVFQMTLSIEDRKQILNGSFKNSIKLSDRLLQIHECFPLLCSAFQLSGQQHVVAEEFFTHPFEVFNHQLRSLRISSPQTYITFILLVLDNCSTDFVFQARLKRSLSENLTLVQSLKAEFTNKTIEDFLHSDVCDLCKTVFVDEDEDKIGFSHKIYQDIVCKFVVENHPKIFLRYSRGAFIRERIRIETFKNEKCTYENHIILLGAEHCGDYMLRMIEEIKNKNFDDVFRHEQVLSHTFQEHLEHCLSNMNKDELARIMFVNRMQMSSDKLSFLFMDESSKNTRLRPFVLSTDGNSFSLSAFDYVVSAGLNIILSFLNKYFRCQMEENLSSDKTYYKELAILSGNIDTFLFIENFNKPGCNVEQKLFSLSAVTSFQLRTQTMILFLLQNIKFCGEIIKYTDAFGSLYDVCKDLNEKRNRIWRAFYALQLIHSNILYRTEDHDFIKFQHRYLYDIERCIIKSTTNRRDREKLIQQFRKDYLTSFSNSLQQTESKFNIIELIDFLELHEHGISLLDVAAINGNNTQVTKILDGLLLEDTRNTNNLELIKYNVLRKAVYHGKHDTVEILLQYGVSVSRNDDTLDTPLMIAAKKGYVEIANQLLRQRSNVNERNQASNTAMYIAACHGNIECVKVIHENGGTINISCEDDMTPLAIAAKNGHEDTVKYLISNGAFVNAPNDENVPLIISALKNGHSNCVDILLEHGSEWKFIFPDCFRCCSAISTSDCRHCILEFIYTYFEYTKDLRNTDGSSHGGDSLSRDVREFRMLVDSIITKHVQNSNNLNCWSIMAKNERTDIMKYLLGRGVDLNMQLKDGSTVLYLAASLNKIKTVHFLVENGANVNSFTVNGDTPLLCSLRNGNSTVAEFLISKGADVDQTKDLYHSLDYVLMWENWPLAHLINSRMNGLNAVLKAKILLRDPPNRSEIVSLKERICIILFAILLYVLIILADKSDNRIVKVVTSLFGLFLLFNFVSFTRKNYKSCVPAIISLLKRWIYGLTICLFIYLFYYLCTWSFIQFFPEIATL